MGVKDYDIPAYKIKSSIIRELRNNLYKAEKEGDTATAEKCRVALNNYSIKI